MSQPKVSIVVPIYNLEQYVPRCLDALVNQTLEDIEILCVNDGSRFGLPTTTRIGFDLSATGCNWLIEG